MTNKRWPMMAWLGTVLVPMLIAGCGGSGGGVVAPRDTKVAFDFAAGAQGWTGGFADYPAGQEQFYELVSDYRALPAPLDASKRALFISGNNHSDDLLMFFKRRLSGLRPGTAYRVQFEVEIATDVPSGCSGIGGSPGESVFVKAGASTVEPRTTRDTAGLLRLNIDIGQQGSGGANALVLGNVANSQECGQAARSYQLKRLSSGAQTLEARSDAAGTLWLLVGTDSGFEGTTSLFYTKISATLRAR